MRIAGWSSWCWMCTDSSNGKFLLESIHGSVSINRQAFCALVS